MAKTSKKSKQASAPAIKTTSAPVANWKMSASAKIEHPWTPREGRPLEIEDLYRWSLVGNASVSPDGSQIVAEVQTIDKDSDEYRSSLWMIDPDGKNHRRLTSGKWNDSSPTWSPDGSKIAFVSNRDDKKNQLFVLPVAGGEAMQITKLESGVGQFVWLPDNDRIAFVSRIAPEKESDSDVKVIRSARYKFDGMGFLEDKMGQVFIVSTDKPDAEPEQITEGQFNHGAIAISPNGYDLALVANREPNADVSGANDLYLLNVNNKQLRKLTDGKGSWGQPVWSDDGSRIAIPGNDAIAKLGVNANLFVIEVDTGKMTRLGKKLDRTVGDAGMSGPSGSGGRGLYWTPDGNAVDCIVSDSGYSYVVRFPLTGSKPTVITPYGLHLKAFDYFGGDLLVTAADPTTPVELYRLSDTDMTPITSFNAEWLSDVALPTPEEFWIESEGDPVQGWLLRPEGNTAKSKDLVPVILNIHGGPHAQFTPAFFHELQMFVAKGYALVFINPRGSTGREDAFARAVQANWGFADMPDFMSAVDHVLSLGGLDPERLGVTGGSYGGFSTNWLLGHTDRFKAAVTDRSISNMTSMYGTDDISIPFMDPEMGTPWDNQELYWNMSPLKYVANFNTPLLIVHSEYDFRCPMEQAEQLYMALKRLGQTVEFVRFPDESHGLGRNGKPKHRAERLERTLGWFEAYL